MPNPTQAQVAELAALVVAGLVANPDHDWSEVSDGEMQRIADYGVRMARQIWELAS